VQFFPEWTVTPFGPVVVPLTRPLPAVIEVETAPRPLLDCATLQLPLETELLPPEAVLLEPTELPTLTELLEVVCAVATDAARPITTNDASMAFTSDLQDRAGEEDRLPGMAQATDPPY
jgi:hypothetical protein